MSQIPLSFATETDVHETRLSTRSAFGLQNYRPFPIRISFFSKVTSHKAPSPAGTSPQHPEEEANVPQVVQETSLAKSKPVSDLPQHAFSDLPKDADLEFITIVFSQLSILLITATQENYQSHHRQIRYILATEKSGVDIQFYHKLLTLANNERSFDADPSPIDHILRLELSHLASDCSHIEYFIQEFKNFLGENCTEEVFKLIDYYSIDPVVAFTLVSRLADPHSPKVKSFFEEYSSQVPKLVIERSSRSDKSWCHLLLDCILRSPTYPFLHKLSTIGQFNAFDSTIPPVQTFFLTILKMSFKELLIEIGPENLLPEKLLPSLLQIKPDDADESIALILAEILIPGSQGLSGTNGGVTALTFVNNLPEANAKGAQLQACLKTIDSNKANSLNWYAIFSKVQEYLFDASKRNAQPSIASVTQLFSALDFKKGLIDIMLSYEWWFNKTLLYMLQSMYTQQGAFDIMSSKTLTLCYDDEVNNDPELLKFVNIAKLELEVISKINSQTSQQLKGQSEGDRKLDSWLTQFFELHCRSEPHHVIAGALAIPDKNGFILDRIDRVFAFMMDRQLNEKNMMQLGKVLNKLKEFDIKLAIAKLIDYYTTRLNAESLTKVVHVTTLFNLFDELISKAKTMTYGLYLSFIIEASNNSFDVKSAIEADLKNQKLKPIAYVALVDRLEARMGQDYEAVQQANTQSPTPSKPMKVSVTYALLEILKGSQGLIDPERLKNLQLSLLTTYPRLINFGTGHDVAILANEEAFSNAFPTQVEQEMKNYYSKMYNKEMDIKEIVDMLTRMKVSDDPHDQDVFACMIHSLIDEYRFFSEYPLTALASTSLLFGALLQKDLIQGTTLTVALNFIWESCNQPQDSHMFKFAVQSLYNFKSRLHEYPMYCKHLLKCQSLSAHAKMYQIVKDASNGIACPESNTQPGSQVSEAPHSTRHEVTVKYNSITAVKKTVGFATQEEPGEYVSDKLLFFVNNMTSDNMYDKLAEVEDLFAEKYFAWFANYLVKERAKTEPNNHTLYSNLVFALKDAIFYEYVLDTTLLEVEKLLRSFKDTTSERSHLKNLGSWLGKITLANDKPLKRDQVALKYLLVESFDFKTLHIVIPLVCKILEQASHSRIFRAPNPWVLGIIKVLAELYECADLKLNLKFEIEVLLNALDMKIKNVEPSTLVRTHNPNPEALAAMFGIKPDANLVMDGPGLPMETPEQSLQMQQQMQQQAALMQQQQFQQYQQVRQLDEQIPPAAPANQLDAQFSKLLGNTIFTQNPNLRRAFQAALARSVRECAVPILTRVSEAVLTTVESLIRKDFATEADVVKFRKSYQILAQQLAHSMVICSGRKILVETIEATMIQVLGKQLNPNEMPLSELNMAIQSNVELCVEVVENLAVGNVSDLIEERMRAQIALRERHPPNKPFLDENLPDYALRLPPPLGLQSEGLRDSQLSIYMGFGSNSYVSRPEQLAASQQGQAPQPHPSQAGHMANPQSLAQLQQLSQKPEQPTQSQMQHFQQLQQQQLHQRHTPQTSQVGLSQNQDFRPTNLAPQTSMEGHPFAEDIVTPDQLFGVITQMSDKLISLLSTTKETTLSDLSGDHPILMALTQILTICQNNSFKHPELLLKVAQYAVNCLFTQVNENPMSNEIYVVMLDKLCECSPSTAKDVTWWMVHSVDQRKFNMPVIFSLLKVQLVSPIKLDGSIGKLISEGNSPVLVKFASSLLLNVFSAEGVRPIALRSEFACTLDALMKYKPENTEEHQQALALRNELFELLNRTNVPLLPSLKNKEAEGFVQMGYIFVEWVKLLGHSEDHVQLQSSFIDKLFYCGILTDPSKFQLFFKAATEIATTAFITEHEIRSRTQREVYLSVDCLAILIVRIILKFSKSHSVEAIDYLKNIFGVISVAMIDEHEGSKATWNERAYFKFFSSLMCVWCDASILDADATTQLDLQFYTLLGNMLNSVQPIILSGFTFAWISLISHRMFLPKVLELPEKSGYNIAVKLLMSLLKFQNVYSKDRTAHQDVISVIFKAINRVFTALAHDQPEFLIDCHYQLVSAVPANYIQVKNIILSATPKSVKNVSPYSKDLDMQKVADCQVSPDIHYSPLEDLAKVGTRKPVENYLRIPAAALLRTIYAGMRLNHPKEVSNFGFDTVNFNVKLINALVLHIGVSAVEDRLSSSGFSNKSSQVSLIVELIDQGDTEFRFHTIDAIMNQLRYPNTHTQWFINFVIFAFSTSSIWASESVHEEVQEIVARVLLERHVVNKPHPWGLTVLLTQILSNTEYKFNELSFMKNASDEMKSLFSVLSKAIA